MSLVCHHSGTSKEACPYRMRNGCSYAIVNSRPTPCDIAFVACPDLHEMYAVMAPKIRENWPAWRLDSQEGRQWDKEIPAASRVWVYAKS